MNMLATVTEQNHFVNEHKNVLLVDDESAILKALKRSLVRSNYKVFTAESAEKGLALMEEEDIQVVLSDFRMPHMSGGELVKEIKQRYPSVVSMIISGYADFDSAIEVLNSGAAFKFLKKPWSNEALIEDVDKAFFEYRKRNALLPIGGNETLPLTREKALFEHAVNTLLESSKAFAVASVRIYDLPFITRHIPNVDEDAFLQSIRNMVLGQLVNGCETYHVEQDQLFIVIPEIESEDSLQSMLFELNTMLSAPINIHQHDVKMSCALAYAMAPFDGSSSAELLLNLRAILTPDVQQQNNVVKFDCLQLANKKRRLTIQSSIKQALEQNQFTLYYQPKVRLDSGLASSAEVLMRWQHNELGWISPSEFINLSELDGQIEQIGTWLLENSVRHLAELQKRNDVLERFAINVSTRQLANGKIVDQIAYLLTKYNVKPDSIELEITETCLMEDIQQHCNVLWQLKLLGVRIAIDDFGTGYSSFAYLTKLPIDVLKLDKVLLDDLVINQEVKVMLKSLIDLCHQVGIEVVAEGVESEEQVAVLREFGCDYIQGFIYSKAITRIDLEKLLFNQPFKTK